MQTVNIDISDSGRTIIKDRVYYPEGNGIDGMLNNSTTNEKALLKRCTDQERIGMIEAFENDVLAAEEDKRGFRNIVYPRILKQNGDSDEDAEYYAMCLQTVETLKLKNVEFTGSVDVAEYMGKLDIMVLSSISEGQPLAVLEGMAAHRPFVTTNVGCCRELIYGTEGDNLGMAGAVTSPMDYQQMAREIIRLGKDFDLRRRMGNIGYKRAKAGYTFEKFINEYRDIYAKMEAEVK